MSYSKEEIYNYLAGVMEDLFEIEASELRPDANLYEDLGIDSIDAVDMVVKLREFTGKKIAPTDFRDVRTMQEVVDAVHKLLDAKELGDQSA